MRISGVDYILYTKKDLLDFFDAFELKLKDIWKEFYKESDFEEDVYNVFYAADKITFEEMEQQGFFLNGHHEGPFYIIFDALYAETERQITLVLPAQRETSAFCERIFQLVNEVCCGGSGN
ncbi:hypothetical protein [Chitinophaga solisilvae]|uniref:hypothetical protein n=1 Tax=Chitinophaga solisilvae TaxID=1233460 RepID=UPI00136BD04F|nr:hypothetical protein [Chitinophaga solisilvae]